MLDLYVYGTIVAITLSYLLAITNYCDPLSIKVPIISVWSIFVQRKIPEYILYCHLFSHIKYNKNAQFGFPAKHGILITETLMGKCECI